MKPITLILFNLLFIITLWGNSGQDSLMQLGKNLFRTNCKACHNIDKKLVGPALSEVYARRDSAWLYTFIKGSQDMIASGDPIATELYVQFNEVLMPNQTVNDNEIDLILNYIKYEDTKSTSASDKPISRPATNYPPYSDHFRFSNYIFWIPFTISVIIAVVVLYYLTIYHDIIEENVSGID